MKNKDCAETNRESSFLHTSDLLPKSIDELSKCTVLIGPERERGLPKVTQQASGRRGPRDKNKAADP